MALLSAKNLKNFSSSPAPKELEYLYEIKSNRPTTKNVEISLQKLDDIDICVWMTGKGGSWTKASDFFSIQSITYDKLAWDWYYEHISTVEKRISDSTAYMQPGPEDLYHPELWKSIHWNWFFDGCIKNKEGIYTKCL